MMIDFIMSKKCRIFTFPAQKAWLLNALQKVLWGRLESFRFRLSKTPFCQLIFECFFQEPKQSIPKASTLSTKNINGVEQVSWANIWFFHHQIWGAASKKILFFWKKRQECQEVINQYKVPWMSAEHEMCSLSLFPITTLSDLMDISGFVISRCGETTEMMRKTQ